VCKCASVQVCKCARRDTIVKLKKRGIVGSGVRIEFGANIRGKSA